MNHFLKQMKYAIKAGAFALLLISTIACDKNNAPNINKRG